MQLGTLGAAPAAAAAAWLAGDRDLAGRLVTAGSVSWLLSKGVKLVVRRDRPATLLPGTRGRGRDAAGLGYLSGHAGVAVALGAAALPRLGARGRALVLAAIPAVALMRVYPQHCPPGATQVLFHDGIDQVRRSLSYFHSRPAPPPE